MRIVTRPPACTSSRRTDAKPETGRAVRGRSLTRRRGALPFTESAFNMLVDRLTDVFRTHTVTTYPAPKSPGHQHWVSTSLGRHADAAAARIS